ncbi:thioredoxin domain-containing protein [Candidatus Woesearchaeota archaeon]|nr:thioredoxin domain-containing protein [Candidatus Woesearchaeota archaeon]
MKTSHYLELLIGILVISVFFASLLNAVFIVHSPEIQSFNTSLHNSLTFDDAYRGTNSSSNITFAYFFSFNCPVCVEQHLTIDTLMQEHPEVNFLFKHLVDFDDETEVFAAKAFECTKEQGKSYELADYLFSAQYTVDNVLGYIDTLGIDDARFQLCMSNNTIDRIIQLDSIHASNLKVRGTPTTFLNGIRIEGLHTFEVYDEMIKKEISDLANGSHVYGEQDE